MPWRLVVADRGTVVAHRLVVAASVRARMRGLLGRSDPAPGEGLLLDPCKQVHTFGMRYPIDVVFLDREWRVTRVIGGMRPGRVSRVEWTARLAVELPIGDAAEIAAGDRLRLEPRR